MIGPADGVTSSPRSHAWCLNTSAACGSGDEAGGSPLQLTGMESPTWSVASPVSEPSRRGSKSPVAGNAGDADFAVQEARLKMLLNELHETVFVEECFDSHVSSVMSPRSASPVPEEICEEASLIVRNLDTGAVHSVVSQDPSGTFYEKCADPSSLRKSQAKRWETWWQEQRQCNEELWKAAETGSMDRLCEMLSASGNFDDMAMGFRCSDALGSNASVSSGTTAMKVQIDARSLHGRTALHLAASSGHVESVQVLLQAKAAIEAKTDAGFTALHMACQRGHLDVVKNLQSWGCDLSAQTAQGEHALHLAASKGHTAVLQFLLEHCDNDLLVVRNSYGQRPAEVCQDIDTVALFCSVDGGSSSHLGSVCSTSICSEAEDSYAGRTPFHQGSVLLRNSRADVVRRLLTRTGVKPGKPQKAVEREAASESVSSGGADGAAGPEGGDAGAGLPRSRTRSLQRSHSYHERSGRRHKRFSKLRSENLEVVGPDSFSLKAVLGKGSFGEVYQVVHRRSGQVYAMKVLRKSKIFGRNLVRYAMTERNLLSYVRHPFIVRLHYAFQTPTCLVLVLHYCSGGSLASIISHEGRLPEPVAQLYTAEIFLAIEYLHERQVVYRDLKPENIVHDEQGHAMLTDFGLSKEGVEGLQGTKSFCGSVAYLAPEILARKGHGPPVDLYGLGVLLYECLAGRPPFYSRDRDTLFRNIAGATLHVPSNASNRAASLMHALMHRDPAQRLGAQRTSEVRDHSFFASLDFDRVLRREVPVPPLRKHRRELAGNAATGGAAASPKVASPFEGRIEAQVRRSWSSSQQDVSGWEFATAVPGEALPGSPRTENSRTQPVNGTGTGGSANTTSRTSRGPAESEAARRRSRRRGPPIDEWLAPTFF
mmetsp:Transcript_134434/g.245368  ORF Transcript_134434/g.245368 Transcript_134434/m.245368 type:complete len:881 (-) Transcript_134434:70-2712(-)